MWTGSNWTARCLAVIFVLILAQSSSAAAASSKCRPRPKNNNTLCHNPNRTYSDEVPQAGKFMPWVLIPLQRIGFPAKQYITVVNLTPHRFVLERDRTYSYQMDTFDFDDVPQGRARQNTAAYTMDPTKQASDDGGEAFYTIQGTDKRFEIRARTSMDDEYQRRTIIDLSAMGLGQREYLDPGKEAAVTLVIAGSDSYGFVASLRHGPANWMKGMYDVIKDRQLQHVVMPATHDSGMSRISDQITSVGASRTTQNQGLTIYDQLRAGARVFDLRVGSVHKDDNRSDYAFWTMHVSDEKARAVVGNTGESLDEVIDETNRFTAENPGELIFFRVRYLIGMSKTPVDGPIYWTPAMATAFFDKLRKVNNRCANLSNTTAFNRQKASYFMDQNQGKGCVIFLLGSHHLNATGPQDSPAHGIYPASRMDVQDHWSDKPHTDDMAADQVAAWQSVPRDGGPNDRFLISQWLVTVDPVVTTALTVQKMAVVPTNPALYWMGLNSMNPQSFPSAILVDYIGVVVPNQWQWDQLSADLYAFAIGMNLYMVSENCNITSGPSPLLSSSRKRGLPSARGSLVSSWNGIIYANGSVVDAPPSAFHPGRAHVLRKGTRFVNGTVAQHDVMHPLMISGAV